MGFRVSRYHDSRTAYTKPIPTSRVCLVWLAICSLHQQLITAIIVNNKKE